MTDIMTKCTTDRATKTNSDVTAGKSEGKGCRFNGNIYAILKGDASKKDAFDSMD